MCSLCFYNFNCLNVISQNSIYNKHFQELKLKNTLKHGWNLLVPFKSNEKFTFVRKIQRYSLNFRIINKQKPHLIAFYEYNLG